MNPLFPTHSPVTPSRLHRTRLVLSAALCALLLMPLAASAAPGAHGPNGEHLDAPTSNLTVSTLPRLETYTEAFELVAELRAKELAIVIDRYESNAPVLDATLEVESGSLKAVATFRAEQGDYAVTDAALLQALRAPGEHALVFTLLAGEDSDLLDGTLVAAGSAQNGADDHGHDHGDHDHDHGHGHGHGDHGHALERAAWIGGGLVTLGLVGGIAWWRQRGSGQIGKKGGL